MSGILHVLIVNYGPTGQQWQFCFSRADEARRICDDLADARVDATEAGKAFHIKDNYGQIGWLVPAEIHGVLLRNLADVAEAEIACMIQGGMNQMEAQRRVQNPTIMAPPAGGRFGMVS